MCIEISETPFSKFTKAMFLCVKSNLTQLAKKHAEIYGLILEFYRTIGRIVF